MARFFHSHLLAFAALIVGTPAAAQTNEVLDAPELRNFSLPGTRTTPPAPEPEQPVQREPAPVPVVPPRPTLTPARPPIGRTPPPEATVRSGEAVPAPQPETQAEPVVDAPITPAPAPEPAIEEAPEPLPAPAPATQKTDWTLWALAGGSALLVLLAAALFLRQRRRAVAIGEAAALAAEPAAPPARPAAPPPPPPAPAPRLEVEFRPERLVTTDAQAAVHFEVTLRNMGDAAARNMRIEARLFNASGAEARDVDQFFRAPAQAAPGASALSLPPMKGAQFTSAVMMPRQQMRPVEMAGRPLFIPTVALKIIYDSDGGMEARVTRRYLVGIEPKEATGKMGPFRLDVGPRIYRQVGQRPIAAA